LQVAEFFQQKVADLVTDQVLQTCQKPGSNQVLSKFDLMEFSLYGTMQTCKRRLWMVSMNLVSTLFSDHCACEGGNCSTCDLTMFLMVVV